MLAVYRRLLAKAALAKADATARTRPQFGIFQFLPSLVAQALTLLLGKSQLDLSATTAALAATFLYMSLFASVVWAEVLSGGRIAPTTFLALSAGAGVCCGVAQVRREEKQRPPAKLAANRLPPPTPTTTTNQ